ncbi:MAG: ABC transporter permease, partial [Oscillospiraceae bacterium]|nr:ABC transporter permease [Oscillospiraceae bacterium]
MKLTAKLAYSQVTQNRGRSVMTVLGIALSSAMLTAVCGFAASAKAMIDAALNYDYDNAMYNSALLTLGGILSAVIVAASVIVVSNAFRVSAASRTRQFGILKSAGATRKQIARTVLYEGVFLSVVGIPAGIVAGLLIELLGISVITWFLHSLKLSMDVAFPFAAPLWMFAAAIVISFGTVLLSAWLPARKAAKISAMDAIRGAGEVKIKTGQVRTSRLTARLFGFEGTLAAKSLRRSRRSFRATVVSLTMSIVLVLVAGSFGTHMARVSSLLYPNINVTAKGQWFSSMQFTYDEAGNESVRYIAMDAETAQRITDRLREYPGASVFGVGSKRTETTIVTLPRAALTVEMTDSARPNQNAAGDYELDLAVVYVDAEHYAALCETAGAPYGTSILVNLRRETTDGKRREYAPFNISALRGTEFGASLGGELRGGDVPSEIFQVSSSSLTVIAPASDTITYLWFTDVADSAGFSEFAERVIEELAPRSADEITVLSQCVDVAAAARQTKNTVSTIMFFVYGFVGMLALIAVTSVVSTISTNIRSRAREFAVLQSVGMTRGGMKKMLNLESVLCSARSLLFGLPLGAAGAYAVYAALGLAAETEFVFPWLPLLLCVLGVFAVTWITMRHAAGRLKRASVIDAIRAADGV